MIHTDSSDSVDVDRFHDSSLQQKYPQLKQQQCPLCAQPSLQILINNALYHKYLDTQYVNYLRYIDNIMDGQICTETVKHKEMNVIDEQQQFMRRVYNISEYDYKNKAIVQYYKFHQDYPKLHIKGVSTIMDNFYDRKKQFQYKKIKRILKQQQNISITTQKSSQIFSDIQEDQKKSHYSNVLNDLTLNSQLFNQQTNQSLLWKNMCKKIDKAFQSKVLSPINFKKKSIFDQPQQKQTNQTKNFVNYLKKQQQKKQKQQKYKNFIRSNKQSKYNSIQHTEVKKYASGIPSESNFMKKIVRKQKSKPINSFKGPSAFYDGKIFYNSNAKGSFGSSTKDQKTKQQSNTPSIENLDFDNHYAQSGFKKNNEPYRYDAPYYKKQQIQGNLFDKQFNKNKTDHFNLQNFKSKGTFKTTQEIYKNATQQMKLKKRSASYNSLANTNLTSKRSSLVNILALKQKDFQVKNRASSQTGKLLKQKNGLNNQTNLKSNIQSQTKIQRLKSSNNFRTSRSVPKFYQYQGNQQSQNKISHQSVKKISVPKQIIKTLKGKSSSASKLRTGSLKYNTESKQKSGDNSEKQSIKNILQKQGNKQKRKDINLFIQNGLKKRDQKKDIFFSHHSSNNMNIEKLLNAKLVGKNQNPKPRQHKILI